MYDGGNTNRPKPYSQLAAIQLGFLLEAGAIAWDANARAANGQDVGAFVLHIERFPAAVEALMRRAAGIKARGDQADALALVRQHVEGGQARHALIAERLLRLPKVSFVYALEM
jgi:hypothetical protein